MEQSLGGTILEEIRQRLVELGLSEVWAEELYSSYGSETIWKLHQNPFQVARSLRQFGFYEADHVAQILGWAADHESRIQAGILAILEQAQNDGHCALPRSQLVDRAATLLQLSSIEVEHGLNDLGHQGTLVEESIEIEGGNSNNHIRERLGYSMDQEVIDQIPMDSTTDVLFKPATSLIYALPLWQAESQVAKAVATLCRRAVPRWSMPGFPPGLAKGQRLALEAVAQCSVLVVTGAPGTGKSTIVQHIMALARANGVEVMLAAPTGRAAKRLEESTGALAKTIHRLLEVQGRPMRFGYHGGRPLPPGLLVVDESSMIDMPLAQALMASLNENHRLVFLGDVDQLPSVGPGQFLNELISGLEFSTTLSNAQVVRLSEVFRQTNGSVIVQRARQVLRGEMLTPEVGHCPGRGEARDERIIPSERQFEWIRANSPQAIHDIVIDLVTKKIPQDSGLEAQKDIQVLCPVHAGLGGTVAINRSLQAYFRGPGSGLDLGLGSNFDSSTDIRSELRSRLKVSEGPLSRFGFLADPSQKVEFFPGDRVMQTENDYRREIFNGDVGIVVDSGTLGDELIVDFGDRRLSFQGEGLSTLQLAYALTIHKSQGNEFPAVVIPLLREHQRMLQRNLLYTAMTRAISRCVIVGDTLALRRAIRSAHATHRHTGFLARLREELRVEEGIDVEG